MKITSLAALGFLLICAAVIVSGAGCTTSGKGRTLVSDSTVSNAVAASKWIFNATYVIPQRGRTRPTNDLYTVSLNEGKLIVNLPYFGTAWGGAAYTTQSPLNFTSSDFVIHKQNVKKGKWSVVIKPKDYTEVQSLNFDFYENGSANLNITLSSRSAISFNGNIAAVKL